MPTKLLFGFFRDRQSGFPAGTRRGGQRRVKKLFPAP